MYYLLTAYREWERVTLSGRENVYTTAKTTHRQIDKHNKAYDDEVGSIG